jgi:hypothetical protein
MNHTTQTTDLPPSDRWACPLTWEEWSALLTHEMELHGWPFGRDFDPESYREYFDNGHGPHEAIEEEVNYAD